MAKLPSNIPVQAEGGPVNVAVQRPTVNLKEAENVAEQAVAVAHDEPQMIFAKHGKMFGKTTHPGIEQ